MRLLYYHITVIVITIIVQLRRHYVSVYVLFCFISGPASQRWE